jgi:hypothetical protein
MQTTRSKKEIEKEVSKLAKAAKGDGVRIEEKMKYLIMKQEITTDEPYSKIRTETKIYYSKGSNTWNT